MKRVYLVCSLIGSAVILGACTQNEPQAVTVEPVFYGKYDAGNEGDGGGCTGQTAGAGNCFPPPQTGTQPRLPGNGQGGGGQGAPAGPAGANP